MRLPITRERIRTHFHYGWWQYALLIGLAIFGWNLLYTTTRYRSPEALKVEWYCQGAVSMEAQAQLDALLEELRLQLFPEMEEVTFTTIVYDQTYGDMQLLVWSSAGQGDLAQDERDDDNAVCDQVAGEGSLIFLHTLHLTPFHGPFCRAGRWA